ncbi:MAG: papain-like cysteine peptidase [Lachnospiraceae bacterium]|nr:papain-like cysteine peptidase [Lachnospiraceae bacterium]
MLKKLKRIVKIVQNYFKNGSQNVFFSIGENCLADNILNRYEIKSFSSPFSSGRSNIEYILKFEQEGYEGFVDKSFLKYEKVGNSEVARNKKYVETKNKYNSLCTNGFEFTHHDVISDVKVRNTIIRRCNRLLNISNKNIYMLYHHRLCNETDESLLVEDLKKLKHIYENRHNKVFIYMFTQVIVNDPSERTISHNVVSGINIYKLNTLDEWAGDDEDILWARCDDDLISDMIKDIKANAQ